MTDSQSSNTRLSTPALFDSIVLAVLVVAMCSQLDVRAIGRNTFITEGYVTKQLFVAISDVTLLAGVVWFVARTHALNAWQKVWWPPLPCWALVVTLCVASLHSQSIVDAVLLKANLKAGQSHSMHGVKKLARAAIHAQEGKEALAKIPQFAEYFLLAPLLFVNLMLDSREGLLINRRHLALVSFACAALGSVMIAALQYLLVTTPLAPGTPSPNLPPSNHTPHALFQSANIYAAFLAIALPLLLARTLRRWTGHSFVFVAATVTLAVGLFTMVSIWAVVALCVGIVVAGWGLRAPYRLALVLGATVVLAYIGWSPLSKLTVNRADYLPTQMARATDEGPDSLQERLIEWLIALHDKISINRTGVPKQSVEWFVSTGWAMPRPLAGSDPPERMRSFATGVGPGNYQLNIGPLYQSGSLADLGKIKIPPDSNNLYLVQAISIGLLGLSALCWVLGYFLRQALIAQRRFPTDWLGAGAAAALVAFCLVNVFHAFIERGTGIVLAFVLSLAIVAVRQAEEDQERNTNT